MHFLLFISLHQDGRKIGEDNRMKIKEEPDYVTLLCSKAEKSDTGPYKITLSNEAGSDTVTVDVMVVCKYKPLFLQNACFLFLNNIYIHIQTPT